LKIAGRVAFLTLFPGYQPPPAEMQHIPPDGKIWSQEAFQFMIIVRNSFLAKPGQASKLAAQLKEMAAAGKLPNHRVLTDVTGEFNRVVMEYEVESAAGFEETFQKYTSDPQIREKAKGYTELWITGSRELFRVV
jgi:hypothetical protein